MFCSDPRPNPFDSPAARRAGAAWARFRSAEFLRVFFNIGKRTRSESNGCSSRMVPCWWLGSVFNSKTNPRETTSGTFTFYGRVFFVECERL